MKVIVLPHQGPVTVIDGMEWRYELHTWIWNGEEWEFSYRKRLFAGSASLDFRLELAGPLPQSLFAAVQD